MLIQRLAFCRKRKIKCDGTAPCAGCTKFGRPNECSILYEEASSQGRSYVSYLEDRISKTDRQLAAHYGPPQTQQQAPFHGEDNRVQYARDANASQTDPRLMNPMPDLAEHEEPARALRAQPSENLRGLLNECKNLNEQSPAVVSNPSMHTPWTFRISLLSLLGFRDETGPFTTTLSRAVVQPLIQHYISEVHPFLPLLHLPDLQRNVEQFYQDKASSNGKFMVLMVMCIAASNMSEHPSGMANWNALKFFSTASHTAAYDPESLVGLEATLLVVQFAVLNPCRMNAWYLTSIALRACASLGLHREATPAELQPDSRHATPEAGATQSPGNTQAAESIADTRRRLFWATYAYDRVQCITTSRPCGFEDDAITVKLHSEGSQDSGLSIRRVQIIRLQSIIYNRLYHCDKDGILSETEAAEFVNSKAQQIQAWKESYKSEPTNAQAVVDLDEFGAKLLLYRPCPAIPVRSLPDLINLESTAIAMIELTYSFVYGTVKAYHTQYMIPRMYLAGLALMYSVYKRVETSSTETITSSSAVALALSKASLLLFHFSEKWQVGVDLAKHFVFLHQSFVEHCSPEKTGPLPEEITRFDQFRLGSLQRNRTENAPDFTQVMHRLLSGPEMAPGSWTQPEQS